MPRLSKTLLAIALALLLTAPARAEDLSSSDGQIDYIDTGAASANSLTVSVEESVGGDLLKFVDGALISASGDCTSSGWFVARCPAGGAIDMFVRLEGEDDEMTAAGIGVPLLVGAGAGRDTVVGGSGPDALAGGPGADELHGGPGDDRFADAAVAQAGGGADHFYGDAGDDTFDGAGPYGMGDGADVYDGGPGFDTAGYTANSAGSLVNLPTGAVHMASDTDTLVSVERVLAGDGLDLLIGDGAGNLLAGGAGGDLLFGGDGADRLEGQAGADRLQGGPGPDVLRGGDGVDNVDYDDASGPVLVTLDNQPGDGQDGENDDVGSDVEQIRTTPFGDQVTGSSAANVVHAGPGDDTVEGGDGDDDIRGEDGADHLSGGPGRDSIAGGAGSDEVDAGTGDDAIDVADGEVDRVTCGLGIDSVEADAADLLFGDCEVVARAAEEPSPSPEPTPAAPIVVAANAPAPAVLTLTGSTVKVSRKGRGRLQTRCAGSACAGTLVLVRRNSVLARAPYALAPEGAATVPFRLTRKGRALLRRTGRLEIRATAGGLARRYTLVRRRS
jgi:Ca2+-binding RTX toxin-like protein